MREWNSLISSAFFINLHLSFNSSTIPANLKPYLHVDQVKIPQTYVSYLADRCRECYTLSRPLDDANHIEQNLYFPFRADQEYGTKTFTFVDVIHGVVCISYAWFPSHRYPCFKAIFLWKYVALPCLKLPYEHHTIGFSYDPNMNDFKVVLIHIQSSTCQVYSSRQRDMESYNLPISHGIRLESSMHFISKERPIFVNGTIHWILSYQVPNSPEWRYDVLMFDCGSEEFQTIDLPKKLPSGYSREKVSVQLFEYAGMLAALVNPGSLMDHRVDLWVMEEHGVSTSWKIVYGVDVNAIIRCNPSFEKLSCYGPNVPLFQRGYMWYRRDSDSDSRVYEEAMLLIDHPEAQSYTTKEVVTILSEDPN